MSASKFLFLIVVTTLAACSSSSDPNKQVPDFLLKFPAGSFAYPVGSKDYVTEKNDWRDDWYNAQDFGENRHLGEDWNKSTGGDSDCGEPVYATADGVVVFAGDSGAGWGNVIMIEHSANDGTRIRSLYGHLETITKRSGVVKRREQIGTVGSANGRYKCHLHFELKWMDSPMWNDVGPGYSDNRYGWIDPSEFIERTR